MSKVDTSITAQIRRDLMRDKNLSLYAKNVKIITADGRVTLKGPVRSEREKQVIETVAGNVAGAQNVANQIEVAPAE